MKDAKARISLIAIRDGSASSRRWKSTWDYTLP
ncbi:hypothetical protein I3760_13G031000 [Carya illinoinensis]|nr:hypothetical protein I3760_13G031000 [Carya illinoinensis]